MPLRRGLAALAALVAVAAEPCRPGEHDMLEAGRWVAADNASAPLPAGVLNRAGSRFRPNARVRTRARSRTAARTGAGPRTRRRAGARACARAAARL